MQNASYEQKDPLVIYKVESFHIFEAMLDNLNQKALAALMRGQIYIPEPQPRPVETPSNVSVSGQQPAAPAAPAAVPAAALASGEVVKAPMPGNILKINVAPGQKVEEGDVLIVLEAMKMENEIVATKSGTVAQVAVSKGAVVETGAPLVVIA